MTIKRSDIASQLIPGLKAIFGTTYRMIDGEHKPLFDVEKSRRSFEEEAKLTGLGPAATKPEGAPIVYDDAQEFYKSRYVHETVALGFIITEEAVEDDLYDTFAKYRAQFLGRSMANTKQVKASDVFNNGFNTAYLGGDDKPLFSTTHPTILGTSQSNTVASDFAETALENALIALSTYRDDRGILISATAQSLCIPPALQFAVHKVIKSDLSTSPMTNVAGSENVSNKNDTNAIRSMGFFPRGIHINHRFTDSDAWFIRTDVPNGTKMFERVGLQTGTEGDFDTGNMKFKARERYSFGWSDWRAWYGSSGA